MKLHRSFYDYILPAAAFFITARLALLLAIPPSEAVAVWPPAGIAVAAVMLRGYRSAIGVFLGALSIYLLTKLDGTSASTVIDSLGLVLLLSTGAVIQALLIVFMIRRFVDPKMIFYSDRSMIKFIFVYAPLGCFVAAVWGIGSLWLFDVIDSEVLIVSGLTWWVGDTIGVVTLVPLILVWLQSSRAQSASQRISLTFPILMLMLVVVVGFQFLQQRDNIKVIDLFENDTAYLTEVLNEAISHSYTALYSLKNFLESSEYISPDEFRKFNADLVEQKSYIQALQWVPRIEASERLRFEQHPDSPGKITETDISNNLVSAGTRDEYFPVKYVVPFQGNERFYGYDASFNYAVLAALKKAKESGGAIAARPTNLFLANKKQSSLLVYLPVYKDTLFTGFVSMVIDAQHFFDSIVGFSVHMTRHLNIQIMDVSDNPQLIYRTPNFESEYQNSTFKIYKPIGFYGRQWRVTYALSEAAVFDQIDWGRSLVMINGMVFVLIVMSWLLSVTGRAAQVSREVEHRTLELRQEVAERKQAQQELGKLSLAVEHSPNMVVISDPAGKIEYVNPKFSDITGYFLNDLVGTNINELSEERYGPGFYDGLVQKLMSNQEWSGDIHSRKKNGEFYWCHALMAPVFDDSNQLTHVVSVYQDITESKRINEQMDYQARHDRLTGLVNRYEFERQLQYLLDAMPLSQQTHAFCFCDLDQFKVVNDVSGHIAGDELLRQVSTLLKNCLRKQDVLARLGGDEFGILMENCNLDSAVTVADKILAELEQFRFVWEGALHTLGVSIGVVTIKESSQTITEILKMADSACYTAKDAGRNRVHVYKKDDELLAKREGEISWVGEINAALEENRFELYGQIIKPILDLSLKPSIEVLVRLRRGDELIMPGAFLPAAERYGLGPKLDLWVVKHTFQWIAEHPELVSVIDSLAINLCGHSLGDSRLLEFIYQELEKKVFSPRLVKFEITETSAIANLTETQKFIGIVKSYGCGFSLDDFGSGLSSFAYLKNLPVDYLKIDGMFVKDILHDPIDRAMVKSINEVGQVMNKRTIAEFVENDEILAVLQELGVDYAQGYGVGRPLQLDQLLELQIEKAENS